MTKKDFELIASSLKKSFDEAQGNLNQEVTVEGLIIDLSDTLASKNPRFQRDKFLQACGVKMFDSKKFEKINGHKPSYNDKRWFEIRK